MTTLAKALGLLICLRLSGQVQWESVPSVAGPLICYLVVPILDLIEMHSLLRHEHEKGTPEYAAAMALMWSGDGNREWPMARLEQALDALEGIWGEMLARAQQGLEPLHNVSRPTSNQVRDLASQRAAKNSGEIRTA